MPEAARPAITTAKGLGMGGRHSKACLDCRIRRIKCDLISPACSQCIRAHKTCQGYRDQLSLMFRDGTPSKAHLTNGLDKSSRLRKSPKRKKQSASDNENIAKQTTVVDSIVVTRSLPAPSLDRGVEYFYDNYVTFVSNKPSGRAALPSSMIWNHLFTDAAFHNACAAAGYAGLHNITQDRQYMVLASRQYANSIRGVQATMNDTSKHHVAMLSALILATFEIVSGGAWNVHLAGAITLWRMMIAKGQAPPARTQLYHISYLFISCILTGRSVEPAELSWVAELQKHLHHEDAHAGPLALLTARVVRLYAATRTESSDSDFILQECCILDAELDQWEKNLPTPWHFTPQSAEHVNYTFQDTSHIYHDFWLARMVTSFRWTRILVCHLILTRYEATPRILGRAHYINTIRRLSVDICHSVPYFLEKSIISEKLITPFPVFAGCFVVIFPLAVVGCAIGVAEDVQQYAIGILQMLSDKLGISGATTLVDYVQRLRQQWQRYATE